MGQEGETIQMTLTGGEDECTYGRNELWVKICTITEQKKYLRCSRRRDLR